MDHAQYEKDMVAFQAALDGAAYCETAHDAHEAAAKARRIGAERRDYAKALRAMREGTKGEELCEAAVSLAERAEVALLERVEDFLDRLAVAEAEKA